MRTFFTILLKMFEYQSHHSKPVNVIREKVFQKRGMNGLKLIAEYGGFSSSDEDVAPEPGPGTGAASGSLRYSSFKFINYCYNDYFILRIGSDFESADRVINDVITDSEVDDQQSSVRVKKRTKKELRSEGIVKRRRLAHAVKYVDNCCPKKCWEKICKDDQFEENLKFWNFASAEQDAYIRSKVRLVPLKRRNKVKYFNDDSPKKNFSYAFSIKTAAGDLLPVCRRFNNRSLLGSPRTGRRLSWKL